MSPDSPAREHPARRTGSERRGNSLVVKDGRLAVDCEQGALEQLRVHNQVWGLPTNGRARSAKGGGGRALQMVHSPPT